MRAIVVRRAGGPEVLSVVDDHPAPRPEAGRVLIHVRAFGLNRSELMTRAGGSGDAVRFPRVLGIECAGEVVDTGGDDQLSPRQKVVAVMGGMGRDYDGGYAEFTSVPSASVLPVETSLGWEELAALPESFGAAWGSVIATLGLVSGQWILVRGATASVGMAAVSIARAVGARVIATSRHDSKRETLTDQGADEVIVGDKDVAEQVRAITGNGADVALELVGPPTLADTAASLAERGVVCLTGFLSRDWNVDSSAVPDGRRLALFSSSIITRPCYGATMQRLVEGVEEGRYRSGLARVFEFSEVAEAHRAMEQNAFAGKVVVRVG
jgi:NADPH:quinone reductase